MNNKDIQNLYNKIQEKQYQNSFVETNGKWLLSRQGNGWNDWYDIKCTICNNIFNNSHISKFCPNCGNNMESE